MIYKLLTYILPHAFYMRCWKLLATRKVYLNGSYCSAVSQGDGWVLVKLNDSKNIKQD